MSSTTHFAQFNLVFKKCATLKNFVFCLCVFKNVYETIVLKTIKKHYDQSRSEMGAEGGSIDNSMRIQAIAVRLPQLC